MRCGVFLCRLKIAILSLLHSLQCGVPNVGVHVIGLPLHTVLNVIKLHNNLLLGLWKLCVILAKCVAKASLACPVLFSGLTDLKCSWVLVSSEVPCCCSNVYLLGCSACDCIY